MTAIEIKKERRKIFYDDKTKLIFAGYIILSLIFVLFLFGKLLMNIGFEFISPGIIPLSNSHTLIILTIFLLWTIYGYFIAYTFAKMKIHGIVYRMGKIFDRIAEKGPIGLSFRRNDPFNEVANSFHKMITKISIKSDIKKELIELSTMSSGIIKEKLDEIIRKLQS